MRGGLNVLATLGRLTFRYNAQEYGHFYDLDRSSHVPDKMALQVCSRCRKKRIKCDLQLPACKNCRVADVQCLFWDDSLNQEIPCSYLHSLRQRVQGLQLELRDAVAKSDTSSSTSPAVVEQAQILEQDYHLSISDQDHLPSPSRTAYLGPGNSARLLQSLLKSIIRWHLVNNIQISKRLLPDEPFRVPGSHDPRVLQSFNVIAEHRKLELHYLVPPSTQRTIIEHYLRIVSPEYTLLPVEREAGLLLDDNPLRWASANKDDPGAFATSIVFAISAALITRDLDPNMSSVSTRCRDDVTQLSQRVSPLQDSIESSRWVCVALCALALCELINPTTGQLWELLGRAASTIEHIRDGYNSKNMHLDDDFRGLENSLLKLESRTALHFRRPSPFYDLRLKFDLDKNSTSNDLIDELNIVGYQLQISRTFTLLPLPPEEFFKNLIPLSLQVESENSDISVQSASLYMALHPLFTVSNICFDTMLNDSLSETFQLVSRSASIVIDHINELNEKFKIISVWMAAERVLESGVVWATYLIRQRHATQGGTGSILKMEMRTAMGPILKVSTLLASFAARWKPGLAYVDAWEILVDLLWNTLR